MNSPNSVTARGKPKRQRVRPFFDFLGGGTATGRNPYTRSAGRRTLGRTEARAGGTILSWGVLIRSSDCRLRLVGQCARPESSSNH
jgi:hypothetical protein